MTHQWRICRLCGEGFEPVKHEDICAHCQIRFCDMTPDDIKAENEAERKSVDWP